MTAVKDRLEGGFSLWVRTTGGALVKLGDSDPTLEDFISATAVGMSATRRRSRRQRGGPLRQQARGGPREAARGEEESRVRKDGVEQDVHKEEVELDNEAELRNR